MILELLEPRCVPTVSVSEQVGLFVTGAPAAGLLQVHYLPGVFGRPTAEVIDAGQVVGAGAASNLTLHLAGHTGTGIDIDLNGQVVPGSIAIDVGTGTTTETGTADAITLHGGSILGSVTVTGGSGYEVVLPGFAPTRPAAGTVPNDDSFDPVPASGRLLISGTLTVNLAAPEPAESNPDLDTGALYGAAAPVVSIGAANLTNVRFVGIGANTSIGTLTINQGSLLPSYYDGIEQAAVQVLLDGHVGTLTLNGNSIWVGM